MRKFVTVLFMVSLLTGCFSNTNDCWELVEISIDTTGKSCFVCSNGNYAIDYIGYIDKNKDGLIYVELDNGYIIGIKDN